MSQTPTRYAAAGVDIEKKYEAVERATAAIRRTFTAGVVGDVGLFGGLFDPARVGWNDALLVASTDGVGTKVEVARMCNVFDTVGRDLVNHCINDILVQGAWPLFFLDYIAVGKMDPAMASDLISGCAEACRENGLALLGGETAEMPGTYQPGAFDLAGTIVGAVKRESLLDGSRVAAGQILLGLTSSGLHTNGFSLARHILFDTLKLSVDDRPSELGSVSVRDALLAVHKPYLKPLWGLLEQKKIAAMAHITGGGLVDNVPRVLGRCDAVIDRASWTIPPLFKYLCDTGRVDERERYQVFNMGIGMVLFVEASDVAAVRAHLTAHGETSFEIGRVEAALGTEGVVRWAR
ncbi:MAG: phosphoribosylformylglycinamidine cyclo-ligase [Planctomycetota bacterium]|nr:phosphoribosylformylglycinamidine cyclo-ligase [Planctomycetota bacterium]